MSNACSWEKHPIPSETHALLAMDVSGDGVIFCGETGFSLFENS